MIYRDQDVGKRVSACTILTFRLRRNTFGLGYICIPRVSEAI